MGNGNDANLETSLVGAVEVMDLKKEKCKGPRYTLKEKRLTRVLGGRTIVLNTIR